MFCFLPQRAQRAQRESLPFFRKNVVQFICLLGLFSLHLKRRRYSHIQTHFDMKKVLLLFLLCRILSASLAQNLQDHDEGKDIIKETKAIKLQQLSIKDTAMLIDMEKLSQETESPLRFETRDDHIFYLHIQAFEQGIDLLVSPADNFTVVDKLIGFFEYNNNLFIVAGDSISDLFSKTEKSKVLEYTSFVGLRIDPDKAALPLIMDNVDDSRMAVLYHYSNGTLKLERVIHNF